VAYLVSSCELTSREMTKSLQEKFPSERRGRGRKKRREEGRKEGRERGREWLTWSVAASSSAER